MSQIVGILNITPDSFSDGGKFNSLDLALTHTKNMIDDGANIIDIGAESTRPTATKIGPEEEWRRLDKILPKLLEITKNSPKKVKTSIDSYHFNTIKKAHELGVDIVNDVSGLVDDKIIDFIASKNLTTILMHCQKIETDDKILVNPHFNVTSKILNWSQRKINQLQKKGVNKSQLIFDPGIGFGKNAEQSIRILKYILTYNCLGLPIYIGHSKKSFLKNIHISNQPNLDAAAKTLIISQYLLNKNIDFLRVHDVKSHNLLKKTINHPL